MKDLFIVRHAKSSWDEDVLDDYDRPLNARGNLAAPLMGSYLKSSIKKPDWILCSPALRCRETLEAFLDAGLETGGIEMLDELYIAPVKDLLAFISGQDDTNDALMVIGHNPGLQQLVLFLAADMAPEASGGLSLADIASKFPTAGFVHIKLYISKWADIAPLCGTLYVATSPKRLAAEGATLANDHPHR